MELDDLAADPGDARDQAATQPTRAPALRTQLEEWRREVGAQAPVPNPPPRARLSQALP